MATTPGKIIKLDDTVINRIAAGEVIQRPANALKELLENALDAGAANIIVTVKSGGMKLLQIQDDGTGIREEDLPIVCERFTTSKLRTFEDLQTIGTYGFRGEALASISHVAHLSIITKTENSQCAFRAEYTDGQLKQYTEGSEVQNPKKCAGRQGTTISIEDLFYNMETRRKAMKNTSDEHNKIADVITRYAIHNCSVGFSLKKWGETIMEIRTPANSNILDNIKIFYGSTISRELVSVSCAEEMTKCKMSGYVSNVNFSTKKLNFTLFINNRLVDSPGLRKTIESIYSNYLPKGSHPFLYLNLEIDPRNVDVNVHPTKHEVHFLHEDAIIGNITEAIENVLLGSNESRTFLVQTLLPGIDNSTAASINRKRRDLLNDSNLNSSKVPKSDPKNMVRTDPKAQKLDRFGFHSSTPNPDVSNLKSFQDTPSKLEMSGDNVILQTQSFSEPIEKLDGNSKTSSVSKASSSAVNTTITRREVRLKSIKIMQDVIKKNCHADLMNLFKNHTFVGCVDRRLALFQCNTILYACNMFKISSELFYQKLVNDFGNFGRISIDDPIPLKELAMLALENKADEWFNAEEQNDLASIVEEAYILLMGKRKMLDDYFSLTFDDEGRLTGLPMLLNNYFPEMTGLAGYIMNLARKVDWTAEQHCFETFCHQTALFYAVPPGDDEKNAELTLNGHSWKWTIEHIIFPELQKGFLPPRVFADDVTIVEITSLPALYKVFERC